MLPGRSRGHDLRRHHVDGEHVTTEDGYRRALSASGPVAAPWIRFPVLGRTPGGALRRAGRQRRGDAAVAARHALTEDRVDVLCVQEYWTARLDVLVRALRTPVVAVDQGLPDRHEVKLLKRAASAAPRGVVVQTEREAAKVGRYGGDARRIPNAVDTGLLLSRRPESADGSHPIILCVGRLHDAQKRISDVIRALRAACRDVASSRSPAPVPIAHDAREAWRSSWDR